jgi:endonuclease-3
MNKEDKFTKDWNWRCFIATMLVCNTKETDMLRYTNKLFKKYPNAQSLARIGEEEQQQLMTEMDEDKINHVGNKTRNIVRNSEIIDIDYEGEVPNTRTNLMKMRGVGRHVSSVVMAWVHNKPEFGVDVHVRRVLKRMGFIEGEERELEIEKQIKKIIPKDQIGPFSRSLVDVAKQYCGYITNCSGCPFRNSCPTAQKNLEW